jgi:hexosaminidase
MLPSPLMQPMAARLCFVASLLALAASGAPLAQSADTAVAIVPLPAKIERGRGSFTLGRATPIVTDASLRTQAHQLAAMLRPATGFALPVRIGASPRGPHLALRLDTQLARTLGPEGYRLTATSRAVTISAGAAAGVF